jgi:hypothetical protein
MSIIIFGLMATVAVFVLPAFILKDVAKQHSVQYDLDMATAALLCCFALRFLFSTSLPLDLPPQTLLGQQNGYRAVFLMVVLNIMLLWAMTEYTINAVKHEVVGYAEEMKKLLPVFRVATTFAYCACIYGVAGFTQQFMAALNKDLIYEPAGLYEESCRYVDMAFYFAIFIMAILLVPAIIMRLKKLRKC